MDDPLYAYLLLRGDLPSLGRGKGAAHAMHAGNHLTYVLLYEPLKAGTEPSADAIAWHEEGGGFGTTISLGGPGHVTLDLLERIVAAAKTLGHEAGLVVDKTYPYIIDPEIFPYVDPNIHTSEPKRFAGGWGCTRKETTAGWLLGRKSGLDLLLHRFALSPND